MAAEQQKQDVFEYLYGERYISLTTYRTGGEAVPTPVWFAEAGGRLYIRTLLESGKVRRLRANPAVTVAPCDIDGKVMGAAVPAAARTLAPDEPAALVADAVLDDKYGAAHRRESARKLAEKGIALVLLEVSPE